MSYITRTRVSHHPVLGRRALSERIATPIVGVLALSWPARVASLAGLAAAMALAVAVAGHLFGGWSIGLWGRGMPASASARAPLFTKAWLAKDKVAMRQFVRSADEAKLGAWIASTPVPAALAGLPPSDLAIKTVSVHRDDNDGAILDVQISARLSEAASPTATAAVVEYQTWNCSGDKWYFSPERPPVAIAQGAGLSRPAAATSPAAPSGAKMNRVPSPPRPRGDVDLDCH